MVEAWVYFVPFAVLSLLGSVAIGILYQKEGFPDNIFTWKSACSQGTVGIFVQVLSIVLALLVGTLPAYTDTPAKRDVAIAYLFAHGLYHFFWTVYCVIRWCSDAYPGEASSGARVLVAVSWMLPQAAALGILASADVYYDIESFALLFVLQFFGTAYAILPDGIGYIFKT